MNIRDTCIWISSEKVSQDCFTPHFTFFWHFYHPLVLSNNSTNLFRLFVIARLAVCRIITNTIRLAFRTDAHNPLRLLQTSVTTSVRIPHWPAAFIASPCRWLIDWRLQHHCKSLLAMWTIDFLSILCSHLYNLPFKRVKLIIRFGFKFSHEFAHIFKH